MAKIVPHRTAPKKGQRIHAKASDTTTTRNRNVFSSRRGNLIEFGDFIESRKNLQFARHRRSRLSTTSTLRWFKPFGGWSTSGFGITIDSAEKPVNLICHRR